MVCIHLQTHSWRSMRAPEREILMTKGSEPSWETVEEKEKGGVVGIQMAENIFVDKFNILERHIKM